MRRFAFLMALVLVPVLSTAVFAAEKNPVVIMDTSMGEIQVELYADKAPNTVKNFLAYTEEKFFDNTVFHRVINDFMIQGGGFGPDMKEKPTKATIKNEADNGVRNEPGTIAMARTNDPHSASAQWFINVANNTSLNHTTKSERGWGYCAFGKVISGMDVVVKIKAVKTGNAIAESQGQRIPFQDVPTEQVVIKTVRVKKD